VLTMSLPLMTMTMAAWGKLPHAVSANITRIDEPARRS
jgi:hypothetical protein